MWIVQLCSQNKCVVRWRAVSWLRLVHVHKSLRSPCLMWLLVYIFESDISISQFPQDIICCWCINTISHSPWLSLGDRRTLHGLPSLLQLRYLSLDIQHSLLIWTAYTVSVTNFIYVLLYICSLFKCSINKLWRLTVQRFEPWFIQCSLLCILDYVN